MIFELSKKQPWLDEKYDELDHLLWEECDSEEKRQLLIELIHRFVHISSEKYARLLVELAETITGHSELSDETTQIVAMAADSSADSSQYILYGLKSMFEKKGWRKYKHVNSFGKSYSAYKKNSMLKNIVLIDEFVGTGSTVVSRVKTLKNVYNDNGVSDANFYVRVMVATEQGLLLAKSNGIDIEALIVLKKGISDFYEENFVKEKIELMRDLESMLSDSFDGRDMPSLGYGETESLYVRDEGNTPNSVFPIFWWPFLKNESERPILLIRAMGDA